EVEDLRRFAGRHQDDVEHAVAVALVKRQTAGENRGALPQQAQLQVSRRLWPQVRGGVPAAVEAAQERGAAVAPGEAGAEVSVPGIPRRRLFGPQLDPQVENGPAQPGAEALAEPGQHLILGT